MTNRIRPSNLEGVHPKPRRHEVRRDLRHGRDTRSRGNRLLRRYRQPGQKLVVGHRPGWRTVATAAAASAAPAALYFRVCSLDCLRAS
jgi:hypothetical protein